MNSRERVIAAINHRTPDRCPIDLGSNGQTGMNVSTVYRLRAALMLRCPCRASGYTVAEIGSDLRPQQDKAETENVTPFAGRREQATRNTSGAQLRGSVFGKRMPGLVMPSVFVKSFGPFTVTS